MPLLDLPSVTLVGQMQGAYREPLFSVDGLDENVTLQELLEYIFNQLGSGGGGTDNFVQGAALDGSNVLTLTLNTGGTVTVDLSSLAGGGGTDNFVQSAALTGTDLVLTLADASTVTADLSSLAGGGGAGLSQYQATGVGGAVDNGCFVTATATGATYARNGGAGQNTEGTLTVPSGAILRGVTVHFAAAQAPGNTFFLNIDYQDTGKAVNGSEASVMPMIATVASKPAGFTDVSPATNYVHSGTPLQVGIAQVDDNGSRTRVRLKITNYNQQVGANASMLSVILP